MKYDTIIIGAGLSGLAAGIRLAYFGQSVCVLEKHTTIGGLNSFYRLRNRNHDVGLHAVTNYAAPGSRSGVLAKLLKQLRMRWEDFNLAPQLGSSIVFPGHTLRFNNDFAYFRSQVEEAFPAQRENFQRLLEKIDAFDPFAPHPPSVSARQVVSEHITDPVLVDMLFCPLLFYSSATPHDMDFSQFVIMFRSMFYEGLGRPLEGIRLILKKLVKKFKSLGGELLLRAGVETISVDHNRATGVILQDGRELEADNILSSAGSRETFRMCPSSDAPPVEIKPGELSFIETISILDQSPAEFGHRDTMIFYNDSERFLYECPESPVDLRSGIICAPDNFQYGESASEGRIRLTALANPKFWMNATSEAYAASKDEWFPRVVESALRYMPDFRSRVVDSDMFTPRTIYRFTGHENGSVYGSPDKVRSGRTHLENLFLCGTDQGLLGIIGSMLSGIMMANLHLLRRA